MVEMEGIEPSSEKLQTKLLQAYSVNIISFKIYPTDRKIKVRFNCLL